MGGVGKKMSTEKNRSSVLIGLTKKWHPQRMKQTNFYILYIYTLIPRGAVNFNHLNKRNVLSEETHLSK